MNGPESNEPAFLRKLRGEYGGADSIRHERPLARPRKKATDGDDDDQPTYVVEGSQDTLSKHEYEALVRKDMDDGEAEDQRQKGFEGSTTTEKPQNEEKFRFENGFEPTQGQVAAIGGAKKKRNVIAIGADDQEDEQESGKKRPSKAKKGKKVKLSFDQE